MDGPKGIGALWIRRGTQLMAQQHGGSQERYRRGGTENVAGAVGFGIAMERAAAERGAVVRRLTALRERLAEACYAVEGVEVTGHLTERLPGLLSLIVRDADGSAVTTALDLEGFAASTGSACTSGSSDPSHVLVAMGYPDDVAQGRRAALARSLDHGRRGRGGVRRRAADPPVRAGGRPRPRPAEHAGVAGEVRAP